MTRAKPFPAKKAAPKGRTLSAFKQAHDKNTIVPDKIRKGLSQLGRSWEYENEFTKRCGIGQTDISRFRDQFSEYWFDLTNPKKRVWAGQVAFAAELKSTIQ